MLYGYMTYFEFRRKIWSFNWIYNIIKQENLFKRIKSGDSVGIISNVIYPSDIISIGGNVAIIILTFLLSLSFLIPNSHNKLALNIIESNSKILLLIFIAVIVFKILIIISNDM